MFQFARQSAKAVLVAAGAAGVAALGAGAAGADDLGALSATDSVPTSSPVTAGLPAGLGGGANSLVSGLKDADLRTVQPAPGTANLGTPAGDMSGVGPQAQSGLGTVHDTVDGTRDTVGLSNAVHQANPVGGAASTLPGGDLLSGQDLPVSNGTVPSLPGGAGTLPLRGETVPQAGPVGILPTGAVEGLLGGAGTLPLRGETVPQAEQVGGAATTLPADETVPQQGDPLGMLPTGDVLGLVGGGDLTSMVPAGGAETLPLSNEVPQSGPAVQNRPAEIAGEAGTAVGETVEDAAGAVLPNTTEQVGEAAEELPAPSTGAVQEQLPQTPASVEGLDTGAVESAVPGGDRIADAAENVDEQASPVDEVTERADVGDAPGDVAEDGA
ncbi:hypothetical protein, partial [Streptomonospora salina]|uniref:hypothetical protein n=1 Tax=Streptomonospora salina TaxID=104205 RepID=UPI0035EE1B5C